MHWIEFVDNPEAIRSLYSDVPVLDPIEIHNLTINFDQSVAKISLTLPTFPEFPPNRWKPGNDAVALTLRLGGLHSLVVSGKKAYRQLAGKMVVEQASAGQLLCSIHGGPDASIEVQCELLRIDRFQPYVLGE